MKRFNLYVEGIRNEKPFWSTTTLVAKTMNEAIQKVATYYNMKGVVKTAITEKDEDDAS